MNEAPFSDEDFVTISLPKNPRLAPWISLVNLGDDRIQLRGAEFSFTLRHKLFVEVLQGIHPMLDGAHTLDEIVSSGGPKFLPTTITFLLKILRANGALQEGSVEASSSLTSEDLHKLEPQIQFLSHLTTDPVNTLALMQESRIAVMGSTSIKTWIKEAFVVTGFTPLLDIEIPNIKLAEDLQPSRKTLVNQLKDVDYLIACHDSIGHSFFEGINALCLETGIRWMHVSIEGTTGLMGPTFIPHQSACYACYEGRCASNVPDLESERIYKSQQGSGNNNEGIYDPLWSILAGQTALEVARALTGFSPPQTIGRLYEFKVTTPLVAGHDVFRLPRCSVCNARGPKNQAWDLTSLFNSTMVTDNLDI